MSDIIELRQQLLQQRLDIRQLSTWKPRDYQKSPLEALRGGCKRVVAVWHRRAGKDSVFLNWTAEAMQERPGVYWHMLPTAVQGRKVIWDGKTKEGTPFLDAFRDCGKQRRREDEMKITFEDIGCVWQVVGSDKFDALVGANPVGVVFSEYAVADPRAWDYIRPILAENGGWACFPYTPRGRNHGSRLYEMAVGNPEWSATLLTIEDTGIVPLTGKNSVQSERDAGMSEEMIQQEFYASWDAPLHGSYYAKEMAAAQSEGRICEVKPDPNVETFTSWDLGNDTTSIWWWQFCGQEIHLIDYEGEANKPLSHFARILDEKKEEHGLIYGGHTWPHDGHNYQQNVGKHLDETMAELGYDVDIQGRAPTILPGIDKVRGILHRCWFDKERCSQGIEALKAYQRQEDESKGTRQGSEIIRFFKDKPLHNYASHPADSFRYGAMAMDSLPSVGWDELVYPDNHVSNMVR